ncbi:hypothetical protein [Methylosinus sp. Sm6]|uniref:hypothetical protein n=1 Tax=Methylosinus sp. Sm6 TaxID=2866948 RepID=UPI001C98E51B|nr:hypothetical protein [Methylosinus sp. Sm6]MBY6241527.1 hypothetical protein [Methylosinus sp. Sm6]
MNGVYIVAKWPHWWQTPELEEVEQLVGGLEFFKRSRRRIAYGASMGGCGVLLSAGVVKCDQALAVAPQVSVSKAIVPFENRWDEDVAAIRFTRENAALHVSNDVIYNVVYDPLDALDTLQVEQLPMLDNIHLYKFPFAGHLILEFLLQAGILGATVESLLLECPDPKALRNRARENRRKSAYYYEVLGRVAARRGHKRLVVSATRKWFELAPDSRHAFSGLCKLLAAEGLEDEIVAAAGRFVANAADPAPGYRVLRDRAYRGKDIDKALIAARSSAECASATPDDKRWLAMLLNRVGRIDDARSWAEQALKEAPADPKIQQIARELALEL